MRLPNIITTLLDNTMLQLDFKVNTRYQRQAWEIGRVQIMNGVGLACSEEVNEQSVKKQNHNNPDYLRDLYRL